MHAQVENQPACGLVDTSVAEEFLRAYHESHPRAGSITARLAEMRAEVGDTGTYRHTPGELAYGSRLALRDSGWCISGVPWRRLKVRDLRGLRNAPAVASECFEHLRLATNGGKIQPMITVFAQDTPDLSGPSIWNEQIIRYAGHDMGNGAVLGDRRYAGFTETALRMGWRPPTQRGMFDHLPLVVSTQHEGKRLFNLPRDVVQEVPLEHPEYSWFAELGLRWHTVPLISNMALVIGGVRYPAAPFNTWFVGTEIATRGLADEQAYGLAREVAERLELDTSTARSLWRDRAVLELNRAVLHSFDAARITIADHHSEAQHRLSWLRSHPRSSGRAAFTTSKQAGYRARFGEVDAETADQNGTTLGRQSTAPAGVSQYGKLAKMNRRCLDT